MLMTKAMLIKNCKLHTGRLNVGPDEVRGEGQTRHHHHGAAKSYK